MKRSWFLLLCVVVVLAGSLFWIRSSDQTVRMFAPIEAGAARHNVPPTDTILDASAQAAARTSTAAASGLQTTVSTESPSDIQGPGKANNQLQRRLAEVGRAYEAFAACKPNTSSEWSAARALMTVSVLGELDIKGQFTEGHGRPFRTGKLPPGEYRIYSEDREYAWNSIEYPELAEMNLAEETLQDMPHSDSQRPMLLLTTDQRDAILRTHLRAVEALSGAR